MVEDFYGSTMLKPPAEYYSQETLEGTVDVLFEILAGNHISLDHPKRSMWVATVLANLWAQSRIQFDATSGWNYWDPDGDGVKEKVECDWTHFDPKCDYGGFQMNAGATLRTMWLLTFGEKFNRRRDLKKLMQPKVMLALALTYLRRQATDRPQLNCDAILHRKGALRKARCSRMLRNLETLADLPTEGDVKKFSYKDTYSCTCVGECEVTTGVSIEGPFGEGASSGVTRKTPCEKPCRLELNGVCEQCPDSSELTCVVASRARRCHRCEEACACEIMRRATGGERGKLDTGLATRMGGSVSAWWIMRYYTTLARYRARQTP